MTDQGEHVPTAQETALYEAMTAGDWDTVAQAQQDAAAADQTPDETTGLTPVEQYDLDYAYAYAHYQADHEAPQEAREVATAVQVSEENTEAQEETGGG